jgi:hypothetical protein
MAALTICSTHSIVRLRDRDDRHSNAMTNGRAVDRAVHDDIDFALFAGVAVHQHLGFGYHRIRPVPQLHLDEVE